MPSSSSLPRCSVASTGTPAHTNIHQAKLFQNIPRKTRTFLTVAEVYISPSASVAKLWARAPGQRAAWDLAPRRLFLLHLLPPMALSCALPSLWLLFLVLHLLSFFHRLFHPFACYIILLSTSSSQSIYFLSFTLLFILGFLLPHSLPSRALPAFSPSIAAPPTSLTTLLLVPCATARKFTPSSFFLF